MITQQYPIANKTDTKKMGGGAGDGGKKAMVGGEKKNGIDKTIHRTLAD
jgi:hypothetical protein